MNHQLAVGTPASTERTGLQSDDVACAWNFVGTGIIVNKRNKTGAMACQISCRLVWAIAELFDGFFDVFSCAGANVRLLVDHTRNGLDRDARKLCDIKYCSSTHRYQDRLSKYSSAIDIYLVQRCQLLNISADRQLLNLDIGHQLGISFLHYQFGLALHIEQPPVFFRFLWIG